MKFKLKIFKNNKKLYILILIIFSFILFLSPKDGKTDKGSNEDFSTENVAKLEERLENILSKIQGAGRVDVMITLASEGEKIILKDSQPESSSSFFDNGVQNGVGEKTVMKKDGSKEEPFIRKQTKAEIRGVIVCADGAYDEIVKNEIISSCIAVLDVPITRVSVVRRKE